MKTIAYASVVAALGCGGLTAAQAQATSIGDASARSLAANCAACHGTQGKATGIGLKLAGLRQDYFVEQMQAFKAGRRESTVMQQLAKGYDDAQIATLAAYFAAQR